MSEISIDRPPIQIFLSYTRQDDTVFGFAKPLKESLETILKVMSGRPTAVFLDRESIELGDNWHEKIQQGVYSSLIFLAVYSANYVESDACREEFMLFQDQSTRLHVSRLLIPIALLGYESLAPENQDEISDYVRAHQFVDYKQAWIQGTDSAAFRQVVSDIATRVVQALESAEDTLAQTEEQLADQALHPNEVDESAGAEVSQDTSSPKATEIDYSSQEEWGLLDLNVALHDNLSAITDETQELGDALSEFQNMPPQPANGRDPRVASKYMFQVAQALKDPSLRIGEHGKNLLDKVRDSDRVLARIISLLLEGGSEEQILRVHSDLSENVETLAELDQMVGQMQQILDSMKSAEMVSASIRKVLRPARSGITAVQDSARVITRWPEMVNSLKQDS
ncbi:toll/interleukin-1 receptor domain-containing protein [Enteractinococcus helveticum]|uniref:TIR domain-containing protein n=1 Tax=Enteractinococcus helveticum TaxID=1837282 RepID=A0A1B7LUR9_9MICC|nr:toll/interleukin-1 receptor domain-containing protein [Enteractinococcus helveticum]OAV51212.1 hypothetical protein A6F49_02185 [Enteractinococcus helveticum]